MPPTSSPTRVLLVEDSPGDARLIQRLLAASGNAFSLTEATSFREALLQLQQRRFDVVLLDLMLPDASGLDVIAGVHATAASAAIVVLTGLDDEGLAVRALEAGARDYLVKGQVDAPALRRSIRLALERSRLHAGNAPDPGDA
jgi:phosphoserine phosphatase RsbU/P